MAEILKDTKDFGYSIIYPGGVGMGAASVYKIYFGRKYFIWKGKSLKQSCEILAKSISAGLSRINRGFHVDEVEQLYHVLKHIKSSKCLCGKVPVDSITNDFTDESGYIDGLAVLKLEQRLLDDAVGDANCLNNNVQAYVPVNNTWITEAMKNDFLRWYTNKKRK